MPDTLTTISIAVNGAARPVPAGLTVAGLLDHLGVGAEARGVAVALGDAVVRRSLWAGTPVEDGARVEVITATAGG
ncbi:MAG: sulfur carrier protein ThiS [Bacteroidota bacterium]